MRPPIVHTTRANAARVILAAYEAGTLSAQAPNPRGVYHEEQGGRVYRCAIGQLFSEDDARRLQYGPDYAMAEELLRTRQLVVDDPDWFIHVQRIHDEWVAIRRGMSLHGEDAVEVAEQRFLERLRQGADA